MKHLSLAVAALCVSTLVNQASANYPFVVYSAKSNGNEAPKEVTQEVNFDNVLTTYKEKSQEKTNFIIFVKDGLTSGALASQVKEFPYIKEKILGSSMTYTNVADGFQVEEFEKNIGAHSFYNVNDISELDQVA